jgi:hypothetical protein
MSLNALAKFLSMVSPSMMAVVAEAAVVEAKGSVLVGSGRRAGACWDVDETSEECDGSAQ